MRGAAIKFPASVKWLTVGCLVLASFTTTWGGLRTLPMGQIADAFLALGFILVLLQVVFGELRFHVPFWVCLAPVAVVLCMAVRWFDPVPYYELVMRMNSNRPYAAQPHDFIKGATWLIALICIPIVVVGCAKLVPRVPQLVMGAFALGVCVSCGVAITDLMGWTTIGTLPLNHGDTRRVVTLASEGGGGRQVGLTSHPNMLGLTCVMAIPLAMYFMYVLRDRWKAIPAVGLIILFGGTFTTGSRGAQVAALVVCGIAIACAPRWKISLRHAVTALGGAAAVGIVLGEIFMGETVNRILGELFRFGGGSYDVSSGDQTRGLLFKQALEDIADYPIAGVGMKHIINAHNIYLELLQAGGVILFAGVVAYWFCMYRDGFKLAQIGVLEARYLMASVAAWMILGMVSNQLTDRQMYYPIGCIAALSFMHLSGRNSDYSRADATVSEVRSGNGNSVTIRK